jgi:hypothetical protein
MNATVLYRIASIVLVLFAAGHTFGFLKFRPPTPEGLSARDAMNNVFFVVGSKRFSYGGFYKGFGLFITVDLLFSAFLAWHLGGLAGRAPEAIGALGWAFCAVQAASLVLSWLYFFPVTAAFSAVVVLCLGWAAWLVR